MNITRISIERPTILAVFIVIIFTFGMGSYFQLNYELVPQFNPPVLTVTTVYPGASPAEVENEVSIIIENAISSINSIDLLTTTSQESFSLVRLEMESGVDVDDVLQEVSRKLAGVADKLPASARKPILSRFDFNDLPVIRMGVYAEIENSELTRILRKEIIPELTQLKGVAEIKLSGGEDEEVMIKLDPDLLEFHSVSILQVINTLGSSNINVPAGFIEGAQTRLGIIQEGRFKNLQEVRDLLIINDPRSGKIVRLGDLAKVFENSRKPDVLSRINGIDALGLDIKKQREANTVELSRELRVVLNELEKKYHKTGLDFRIAQDNSVFTLTAANAVITDLSLAIILVSLVMLVFLHSLKNSLIVFISIPTSIISTFIVMYILGYSLNLLTLLGLSLAIGILVDDSIVVIENIYRHLEMGKKKKDASIEGRMEIGFTAISITMIDVVVFIPIVFANGMVADLLRQFAVVIVVSTLMSLLVSFTLVPFLTSRLGKANKEGTGIFKRLTIFFEHILNSTISDLETLLKWSFKHPIIVSLITLILFVSSIALIPLGLIGIEFTKAGDRSEFIIELTTRNDATLEESNRLVKKAEQILLSYEEVETIFSNVGTTSSGRISRNTAHQSEIYVKLVNKNKRSFSSSEFSRHIKYRLMKAIAGLDVRPIEINLIGLRNDDAVQLTVTGNERQQIISNSNRIAKMLDSIPGAIEVTQSNEKPRRLLQVHPNREKMELLGVDMRMAGLNLRSAFQGNEDITWVENGESKPIRVILDKESRVSTRDISHLTVINSSGMPVPFMEFSRIDQSIAPSVLERTNRSPSVTVKSQVIGRPGGTVSRDLMSKLEDTELLGAAGIIWGGSTKRTQEGISTMAIALTISILLVYLILVALYDSFIYPFVVLFSIPMAIIGALFALALSMQSLSVFSIMGLIMLIGLVGKNAILVVDFTNNLMKNNRDTESALLEAVRLRFRPILMTNLTMIIGLMPIALASGAGSEWKNGLAWVLIGGLSSSMMLSLLIVPVVYFLIDKLRQKLFIKIAT